MEGFKDRKSEVSAIKGALESRKRELGVLYGRRRIGKTELILHATKGMKRIYFLATGEKNLDRFYDACIQYDPGIGVIKKDYESLFSYLGGKVEVVIMDEFQNMVKENENIVSIFQSIVDTKLKGTKLKLFLLGSSISMMTSKVLGYRSPLYGRRTLSMKVGRISFFDLPEFFPRARFSDLMDIYGFADGVPFYLVRISGGFWDWLKQEIRDGKGFLRDEVDFMMKYEFSDPGTYKLVLEAIANGKSTMNEIRDFMGAKRTDITPYIRNLTEIGLVKREVPITENIKSRRGRYFLEDNFLRFWFRFIYPGLSSIEQGIFDADTIRKQYPQYLGRIFEDVAAQYLIKEKPISFNRIGRWWWKDKEIDIVALDDNKAAAAFAECKWKENVDAASVARDLLEKSKFFEWKAGKRKETLMVFAKSFSKRMGELEGRKVLCIDASDMEKHILKTV